MKKISVVIPSYNEEENIQQIYEAVKNVFVSSLIGYNYEILFIDNKSLDNSREILKSICKNDKNVKAIFNVKNFGFFNSQFYALTRSEGDCSIYLSADFQDPPELIPKMVEKWENGSKIVCCIKNNSEESWLMYHFRSLFYRVIKATSSVEQIEHFTGFGLYDKSFIETLQSINDPQPYLRGIVAELGPEREEIYFNQPERVRGKSSFNFYRLYDAAMVGLTSYSKGLLRLVTISGFILSGLSLFVALAYLILKLIFWNKFAVGFAPVIIGMFFIGSVQVSFIGFISEYILAINYRMLNRPLVIEEERINF